MYNPVPFKRKKGFSLVEVAIAIALLSLIILWLPSFFEVNSETLKLNEITVASGLADSRIEYLKTLNFTDIQTVSTSASTSWFSSPFDNYGYKYVVGTVQENSSVYLKEIKVEIYSRRDETNPIIFKICNFLRSKASGENIGN